MVSDWNAWHAAVQGVTKNWTWLSDWTTSTMYIYMESRKIVLMNLFAGPQWGHRYREHTWGQWGKERGMNWERSTETHKVPYVQQTDSGGWLCDSGSSNPGLCDNLEGWGGVGGESEVQGGGWHIYPQVNHVAGQKNHHNLVKKISFNQK